MTTKPSHPRRRPILWVAAALLLVAALAALRASSSSRRLARPVLPDNILLITLDTTRADHLGSYGDAAARTPALDQLASQGVRLADVSATAPLTLPSHSSILTGLYPPEHGVRNNGNFRLDTSVPTLASTLRRQGFRTGAFVSAFVLDRRFGLDQGFDVYDDEVADKDKPEELNFEAQRRGDQTAMRLTRWLDASAAAPSQPFFAWLHLYDPHEPYTPPPPFAEKFPQAPYDGEIAFADSVVAFVLSHLQKLGLLDGTLVCVVGDHGEGLGEHQEEAHAIFIYESTIRVPWILWRPGRLPAGQVLQGMASLADVTPTLLDLAGLPALPAGHSRSLVPLIAGQPARAARAIYAETMNPQFDLGWAPLRSIRDGRYKLIDAPRPELYDLEHDPHELRDIYADQPQLASVLRRELDKLTSGGWGQMTTTRADAETREKLAALGYLAGSDDTLPASAAALRDPKDGIHLVNLVRAARREIDSQRFEPALRLVAQLRKEDPDNAQGRLIAAAAYMGQQRWAEAARELRTQLAAKPGRGYQHHSLALCAYKLGQPEVALRETEAALAVEPRLVEARVLRGRIHQAAGRTQAAVQEYRAAVQLEPDKTFLRQVLAETLASAGQPAQAEAEYRALLQKNPDHAGALAGLGILAARPERAEEAISLLTRSVSLDPGQNRARFVLAQILESRGRAQEARPHYDALLANLRATLEGDPENGDARLNLGLLLERLGRGSDAAREYDRAARSARTPEAGRRMARQRLAALALAGR